MFYFIVFFLFPFFFSFLFFFPLFFSCTQKKFHRKNFVEKPNETITTVSKKVTRIFFYRFDVSNSTTYYYTTLFGLMAFLNLRVKNYYNPWRRNVVPSVTIFLSHRKDSRGLQMQLNAVYLGYFFFTFTYST